MASGYDLSSRVPFRLMQGRLGVYDKNKINLESSSVEGVQDLDTRLQHHGGNIQQERMIKDKRRSLGRAVWFSYQAAEIVKVDATDKTPFRALINPNKLKQDYDDKIVSVDFEYNLEPGDVFEWKRTKTYWLVLLQDLTELAYFRGEIRRCSYEIAWEDEAGKHTTYAAVRGPVETKIDYIQKHGISVDNPNYTLNLLLPKSEENLKFFKRYTKFYLQDSEVCWRVEAIDSFSTPGILEVNAKEYFANETEDDIENGIVGGLIELVKNPNEEIVEETIIGDTFIKVKKQYQYKFEGTTADTWYVDPKYPVKLTFDPDDPRNITIKWESPYCGQFDLSYGGITKTIIVESLF